MFVVAALAAVACGSGRSDGERGWAASPGNTATSAACDAVNGQLKLVVVISNGAGHEQASVGVAVGDLFAVDVSNSNFDVSEPTVTVHPEVLCRVSVSAAGHARRAVLLARQPGTAYVSATITGVPEGINHPAYGVRVTVK